MRILRILLFFPSITFGLLPSEIFPFGLIYSFVIIIKSKKFHLAELIVFYFFLLTGTISIYFNPFSEVIRSVVSYLNVLLPFLVIIKINREELRKVTNAAYAALIIMITVGFLQMLNLLEPLKKIYLFLIPRGNYGVLTEFNRGVSLLSTEPSRASIEFAFLIVLFLVYKRNINLKILGSVSYLNFIIQGGYALLYSILLSITFINKYSKTLLLLVPFVLFSIYKLLENYRGLNLIINIFSSGKWFETLVILSGARIVSVIAAFKYSYYNLLGAGLGSWRSTMIEALNQTGFDPNSISFFKRMGNGFWVPVKPNSILANIALEFGILGLVVFIIFFIWTLYRHFKIHNIKFPFFITPIFITYITLFGYLGNPIPFVVVALIINPWTSVINFSKL